MSDPVTDLSPTQPCVRIPEPGEIWRSRHSDSAVLIVSRTESGGVRYHITTTGGEAMPWESPLGDFLAHYRPDESIGGGQ